MRPKSQCGCTLRHGYLVYTVKTAVKNKYANVLRNKLAKTFSDRPSANIPSVKDLISNLFANLSQITIERIEISFKESIIVVIQKPTVYFSNTYIILRGQAFFWEGIFSVIYILVNVLSLVEF